MDPRWILPLAPLGRYLVDGGLTTAVTSPAAAVQQYYSSLCYRRQLHEHHQHHHHHQPHQQPQQGHWDAMVDVWNPPTATSFDRGLFSVDAILNHSSDTWRTRRQSVSRLETSDLSGE